MESLTCSVCTAIRFILHTHSTLHTVLYDSTLWIPGTLCTYSLLLSWEYQGTTKKTRYKGIPQRKHATKEPQRKHGKKEPQRKHGKKEPQRKHDTVHYLYTICLTCWSQKIHFSKRYSVLHSTWLHRQTRKWLLSGGSGAAGVHTQLPVNQVKWPDPSETWLSYMKPQKAASQHLA